MHRLLRKFSSCLGVLALVGAASVIAAAPAAALGPCTTTCYVAKTGSDANDGNAATPFLTIQKGIDSVSPGGTVNVRPGTYDETASGRTITQSNGGPSGPYQFGLFVPVTDAGITIQGVTAADVPITSAAGVLAHVTTNSDANFGPDGVFIEGDNVTMSGLAIGANNPSFGQNKTIEVAGNNFTLNASDIEDYFGSVYFNDWMYNSGTQTPSITTYNITNNIFRHGVSLDITSGAGGGTNGGPASGRVISGNTFEGDTNPEGCSGCTTGQVYWPAVSFNGAGTTVPWFVDPVGTATISGNTFGASDQYIRHRHGLSDPVFTNWGSFWTGNTFARAAIATTNGNPNNVASYSYSSTYSFPSVERIGGTIQAAHASGCAGADCDGELTHTPVNGTLLLSAGTFNEVVNVNKTVTVKGVQGGVDARTRSGPESIMAPSLTGTPGRTPLEVSANDVTIDGITVQGNTDNNLFGTGVYLAPATHGTQFVNNIVKNNISGLFLSNDSGSDQTLVQHNLFQDNTNAGSVSGTDIYADQFTAGVGGVNGVTINENAFANTSFVEDGWAIGLSNTDATRFTGVTFSGNTITNHGRGGYVFSTTASTFTGNTFTPGTANHYAFGVFTNGTGDSNTNITIDHNVVGCATSCAGTGGFVDDPAATGITIIRNDLQGLAVGISSNATATVDGTCNWWGHASSGPTPGQLAGGGPVTTSPWLNSNNLSGPCAPGAVIMVSNGLKHTCALLGDGTARCWGSNSNGQLGDGTTTQRLQPVVVKNATNTGPLTGIAQIVAGGLYTCARMTDGSAKCWGLNSTGQLGDGTTTQRVLPVTVKNNANTGPLTGITQLAAAAVFSCATISGGTARCWGNNGSGQIGDGTMTQRLLPVSVRNSTNTGPLTAITQLAIRGNHSCARLSDSTARCWGRNANGQLGDGTTTQRLLPVVVRNSANTGSLTGVAEVGAGTPHTCARMNDGSVKCWGGNANGELGDGTTTQRLLPVVVRNVANTGPLTGIGQIAVGGVDTCARLSTGGADCWGLNSSGQLGDGTTTQRLRPVVVKNSAGSGPITGVSQLSARDVHTCADELRHGPVLGRQRQRADR